MAKSLQVVALKCQRARHALSDCLNMLVCLCVHAGAVWRTARGPSHIHGVPGAWVTRTLEWRVVEWKLRGLPVVSLDMCDAMTDACARKGGGAGGGEGAQETVRDGARVGQCVQEERRVQ